MKPMALLFSLCIGCGSTPQTTDPSMHDAGIPDATEDVFVCPTISCTDGIRYCDQCGCEGDPCGVFDADGGHTEGEYGADRRCSVPCPIVDCPIAECSAE